MNFYDLLVEQTNAVGDKIFLRIDDRSFTYKKFLATVDDAARNISSSDKNFFIDDESLFDQAVKFFAAQAVGLRPIIIRVGTQPSDIPSANVDDVIGVMSSGSTGPSKMFFRSFDSWASFFPVQNKIFGVDRQSTMFMHGSLRFTGNLNAFVSTMSVGATIVVGTRLNARAWFDLIDGCSTVYLIPKKLHLLTTLERKIYSVDTIFTGSQSVDETLRAELKKNFPNARLIIYYGASELSFVSYKILDGAVEKNNVGRAFDGVSIEIRDGIIYVDSPWLASGLKKPCTVGDAGHLNDEGELIFDGRGKQCVMRNA